jgi:hypothetical protein
MMWPVHAYRTRWLFNQIGVNIPQGHALLDVDYVTKRDKCNYSPTGDDGV